MEKRIFGMLLTVLGTVGLIISGFRFIEAEGNWRAVLVFGILGLIFFISGISLIKTTKDVSD